MIMEDSETIYQVNPEILNITDKDELLLAQQIRRRSLNWSGNTKVELQFNAWELFWQLISQQPIGTAADPAEETVLYNASDRNLPTMSWGSWYTFLKLINNSLREYKGN